MVFFFEGWELLVVYEANPDWTSPKSDFFGFAWLRFIRIIIQLEMLSGYKSFDFDDLVTR